MEQMWGQTLKQRLKQGTTATLMGIAMVSALGSAVPHAAASSSTSSNPSLWSTTKAYWTPRISKLVDDAVEYWTPRTEKLLIDARDYWYPIIDDQWLAFVRKNYSKIEQAYGPAVAETYRQTMDYWAPIVAQTKATTQDYWYTSHPEFFDYLSNVPPGVKKAFDQVMGRSIFNIRKHAAELQKTSLPDTVKQAIANLSDSMVLSKDKAFQKRLARLLNRIRNAAGDRGMQNCYTTVALDAELINAFNTGCTIFVTSAMANELNDDELTAVLAHEMSHGDQGHYVKNLGLVAGTYGKHFGQLISDEMIWMLTGRIGATLKGVMSEGNTAVVIAAYGALAPQIEISADRGGALILDRAGIPRTALKNALMRLHGYVPGQVITGEDDNIDAIRDYPGLSKRLKAVDEAT